MVKIDTRITIGILVMLFVLALGYSTVSNYLVQYKTVSEAAQQNTSGMIWVNGTIVKGSFTSLNTGEYTFVITDGVSRMNVSFTGELPSSLGADADLVLLGSLQNSTFYAAKLLAKCPTKYQG
ncbi:MAG: cytochrome c maturation protein CcmE [Candidatus Methanoperedens sp.]|nr:cytochrome c maturation protein CcmE [Candidatus Methanoperedens sp.]